MKKIHYQPMEEGEERPVAQGCQFMTPAVGFWVRKRRGTGSQTDGCHQLSLGFEYLFSFTSVAIFVYSL